MATLKSFDLNGKKLSFANWISNLSPEETPFTSMTGKEGIDQTQFSWQTDTLRKPGVNAVIEASDAVDGTLTSTTVIHNNTQILRETLAVSDTANATSNYGRGSELQYQMEKAGKAIKSDLELAFLTQGARVVGTTGTAGKTAGYKGLIAAAGKADTDTGAITNKVTATAGKVTEAELFDLTYNLYLSGSKADTIMFHPSQAGFFSSLQEISGGQRTRIFENTPQVNLFVSSLVDPLGRAYNLVPNRVMPKNDIFFFTSNDWQQMVLRAPKRTELAKNGSYSKHMIEMEVGLRHRHPFASGLLTIK